MLLFRRCGIRAGGRHREHEPGSPVIRNARLGFALGEEGNRKIYCGRRQPRLLRSFDGAHRGKTRRQIRRCPQRSDEFAYQSQMRTKLAMESGVLAKRSFRSTRRCSATSIRGRNHSEELGALKPIFKKQGSSRRETRADLRRRGGGHPHYRGECGKIPTQGDGENSILGNHRMRAEHDGHRAGIGDRRGSGARSTQAGSNRPDRSKRSLRRANPSRGTRVRPKPRAGER